MSRHERYRARGIVYLISVVAFLLVGSLVLLWARGYTVDFGARAIYKGGILLLRSTPDNAFITINNRVSNKQTGAKIKVRPGRYHLKIDRPGTFAWEKELRVEPQQAIVEENIVLFARQPARRLLATGVTDYAVAADHRRIAWLARRADGRLTLTSGSATGDTPATTAIELPDSYLTPTTFAWSADGSRLLLSTATESSIIDPGRGSRQTVPIGGRLAFAPGLSDQLLFQADRQLWSYQLADGQRQLLEPEIVDWSVGASQTAVSLPSNQLAFRQPRRDQRTLLATPVPITELRASGDQWFGRDANRTLYTIRPSEISPVRASVEEYVASADGSRLAYLSNRELYLLSQQRDRLVTRFSEAVDGLAIIDGGEYLAFNQTGHRHTIAADGSNDQAISPALRGTLLGNFRELQLDPDGTLHAVELIEK